MLRFILAFKIATGEIFEIYIWKSDVIVSRDHISHQTKANAMPLPEFQVCEKFEEEWVCVGIVNAV